MMRRGHWAREAIENLGQGRTAIVHPAGHSMKGRIDEGDCVHLVPCDASELKVDDIVLVEIRGRKYSHIVLHAIIEIGVQGFLIGAENGRIDGWVTGDKIFGRAAAVETG